MALVTLLVYLTLMGDIRRVLIPLIGWQSQDPLLLVAPAAAGVLTLSLFAQGRVRLDYRPLQSDRPADGPYAAAGREPPPGRAGVGIAGILFYVVPLLWYWLGRAYVTPQMLEWVLTRVVVPLAFAAAAMGLYQTYVGHLPYQERWIEQAGYAALWVGSRAEGVRLLPVGRGVRALPLFRDRRVLDPGVLPTVAPVDGRAGISRLRAFPHRVSGAHREGR